MEEEKKKEAMEKVGGERRKVKTSAVSLNLGQRVKGVGKVDFSVMGKLPLSEVFVFFPAIFRRS